MSSAKTFIRVGMTSQDAQRELDSLTARFKRAGGQMQQAVGGGLTRKLGILGEAISIVSGPVGIATGAVAGLTAGVGALTAGVGRAITEQAKYARELNISTEQFSSVAAAAARFGVDAGVVSDVLGDLTQKAVNNEKDFENFGIAVRDANGEFLDTEQILANVADRIQAATTETEKFAIADDLASDAGRRLLPVLREGAEGLARYRKEAEENNHVIDQAQQIVNEEFNQAMRELTLEFSSATRELATLLMPALKGLLEVGKGVAAVINDMGRAVSVLLGRRTREVEKVRRETRPALEEEKQARLDVAEATKKQREELEDLTFDVPAMFAEAGALMGDQSLFQDAIDFQVAEQEIASLTEQLESLQEITSGLTTTPEQEKQLALFEALGGDRTQIPAQIQKISAELQRLVANQMARAEAAQAALDAARDANDKELQSHRKLRTEQDKVDKTYEEQRREFYEVLDARADRHVERQRERDREMVPQIQPWNDYADQVSNVNRSIQQQGVQAVDALAGGIGGALRAGISGARSFGEAFGNAAQTIAADVVGSLVALGIKILAVKAIGQAANAAAVASAAGTMTALAGTTSAAAGTIAAAWGPAATAASIATLGGASAIGLSAYLTALAAGTGATIASQAVSTATGALFGSIGAGASGGGAAIRGGFGGGGGSRGFAGSSTRVGPDFGRGAGGSRDSAPIVINIAPGGVVGGDGRRVGRGVAKVLEEAKG